MLDVSLMHHRQIDTDFYSGRLWDLANNIDGMAVGPFCDSWVELAASFTLRSLST